MSPRFTLAGTTYTVRESPDFTVLVNRIITKRFGAAAARDRQDIHETDVPVRSWTGMLNGTTYTIFEVAEPPAVAALTAAAEDVIGKAKALRFAQDARDEAIRAAFASGIHASAIASASGVSIARAYQIRDKRR